MAKVNDPLKRVFHWEWGPENGLGIVKNGVEYILVGVPEPKNATQEYLYQYGLPRNLKVETIASGYNLSDLIDQAESHQQPDFVPEIGDANARSMADKHGMDRYQAALVKFWMTVTGNSSLPQLDDPSDLLDEFTDDIIFQRAADEIFRESPQFIWQFFLDMPEAARRQALWRVAVVNSPSKPGDFGVDSRMALIIKMYLVATNNRKLPENISDTHPEVLIDLIIGWNQGYSRVLERIVKALGYHKAMTYLLSDIQRVKMVRKYIRQFGSGWIDQPYF